MLLFWKRVRTSIPWLLAISIAINIGMWLERFVLIVTSTAHDFLPSSWGTYTPSPVEIIITIASFAWFAFLFLLFAKHLPAVAISEMKEQVAE